jgi:hypothetical protein
MPAKSSFFCLWCECERCNIHLSGLDDETTSKWVRRTAASQAAYLAGDAVDLTQVTDAQKTHGYVRDPLLKNVLIEWLLPDILHLGLRATDQFDELFAEHDLKILGLWTKYEDAVHAIPGARINRKFYEDKKTGEKCWPSLKLEQRLRILRHIDLTTVLPDRERAERIQAVWREFADLYDIASHCGVLSRDEALQFRQRCRAWLVLFLRPPMGTPNTPDFDRGLYTKSDVTPYIHVFVYHLWYFMHHTSCPLKSYSASALEHLNGINKRTYFRSTHRGLPAAMEVLKRGLFLFLFDEWYATVRHSV